MVCTANSVQCVGSELYILSAAALFGFGIWKEEGRIVVVFANFPLVAKGVGNLSAKAMTVLTGSGSGADEGWK